MSTALRATPGQTVGPFFRYGLEIERGGQLVHPESLGAVRVSGYVFDGAGDPVPDALVEIWQADASGSIPSVEGSLNRGEDFTGWGRVHTAVDGGYEFTTVVPGSGFIAVVLFARGLLDRLHTRIYFSERADDALLSSLSDPERATLIARPVADGYRHDLHLQGAEETVFLAFR